MFILSQHNDKVGFFRSDNGRTLLPGKSYLYLNVSEARAMTGFPLEGDGETTGITAPTLHADTPYYYNLQGQRLLSPARGVTIVGGKKVVVKP